MDKDSLVRLKQQLEMAIESENPVADSDLAKSLAAAWRRLNREDPDSSTTDELGLALTALEAAWLKNQAPPAPLPGDPDQQARLSRLIADILAVQNFAISMSKGELSPSLPVKGMMAGGLKALQANLRHLTWQTQMIAQGDFGQRVDFMGEFSESFNSMVSSLAAARRQLLEANQDLEAYSYSVSHDLRAPLRAIEGFGRILLEDYAHLLDAEGLRLLHLILSNIRRMWKLIDDLLAFARLGRQEVEKSEIDMTALTQTISRELQGWAPDRSFSLTVQDLPAAWGDRSLLNQVLTNLLTNAVKFTASKEMGLIEVGGFNDNHETVYYVKDNGAGFDMKYADKLFGVFQRLHRPSEFAGTGVGLAIVQRIIQRHGGRVWAEGKVNEGATFFFSLPKSWK